MKSSKYSPIQQNAGRGRRAVTTRGGECWFFCEVSRALQQCTLRLANGSQKKSQIKAIINKLAQRAVTKHLNCHSSRDIIQGNKHTVGPDNSSRHLPQPSDK